MRRYRMQSTGTFVEHTDWNVYSLYFHSSDHRSLWWCARKADRRHVHTTYYYFTFLITVNRHVWIFERMLEYVNNLTKDNFDRRFIRLFGTIAVFFCFDAPRSIRDKVYWFHCLQFNRPHRTKSKLNWFRTIFVVLPHSTRKWIALSIITLQHALDYHVVCKLLFPFPQKKKWIFNCQQLHHRTSSE